VAKQGKQTEKAIPRIATVGRKRQMRKRNTDAWLWGGGGVGGWEGGI